MKNNSVRSFTNIGFSTILLAFSMICIVTFSALALITANSDYQLSQKVADKNTAYYLAEKEAYATIAQVDQKLQEIYFFSHTKEEFCQQSLTALSGLSPENTSLILDTPDNQTITCQFSETISDRQTLKVCLLITYPKTDSMPFLSITQWQTTTNEFTEDHKPLHVIGS